MRLRSPLIIVAGLLGALSPHPLRRDTNHETPREVPGVSQDKAGQGGSMSAQHASGPFDVKAVQEGTPDKAEGSTLGRLSLDKQYHGALEATGKGEMLTVGTDVRGSGAYVAVERVTGTLNGRSGSFALQHSGTMTQGVPKLNITVVPDSGSGQLVGITGKMDIVIENGKHSYVLDYTMPDKP